MPNELTSRYCRKSSAIKLTTFLKLAVEHLTPITNSSETYATVLLELTDSLTWLEELLLEPLPDGRQNLVNTHVGSHYGNLTETDTSFSSLIGEIAESLKAALE